jgi:hypothetical protein
MISGRQVIEALRTRGAHVPPQAVVDHYLQSLGEDALRDVYAAVRNIRNGVDTSGEFQQLVDTLRALPHAPAERPLASHVPPAVAGSTDRREQTLKLLRSHGTHVYASTAAIKLELAQPRTSDAGGEAQYTLQVEGTRKQGGGYDWRRKIVFQLTRRELPVLAAFLLGFGGKKVEFRNHGEDQDKALTLEDQGHKVFLRLMQASQPVIALPVEPEDLYYCSEICMVALQLNRPLLGPEDRLALLRRVGAMHAAGLARDEEQRGSA